MASRKKSLSPEEVQLQKLVDLGCDQLDIEMKEAIAPNASLIAQWLLW